MNAMLDMERSRLNQGTLDIYYYYYYYDGVRNCTHQLLGAPHYHCPRLTLINTTLIPICFLLCLMPWKRQSESSK